MRTLSGVESAVGPKDAKRERRLFIISGPSGCGKATLLGYVTERAAIRRVVTYTTRPPRPGETNHVDYNFVSEEVFTRMYENGELLEREKVYGDYYYGSPRDVFGDAGTDVIMELDTEGTETYRRIYENIVTIFILPPSADELVRRIEARYREPNLRERLAAATPQLESASSYDFLVINDIVERAGQEILAIITDPGYDGNRKAKLRLAATLARTVSTRFT